MTRLRATVSGHARATIAGRDVHVHYEDGVTRRAEAPDADGECPYPGLAAFTAEQSQWFFGRDALTARLVERAAERLDEGGPLVVVAPSGAGKSSLLRAGLLTAIDRGALPVRGSARWPRLVLTPTDQPVLEHERDQRAAARRRTRRLKLFVALLTALVLVLAATATYAVIAERRADQARTRAVAQQAVMKATSLISTRPELAVALAHAAYRVVPTPETRDALLTAHLAVSRIPRGDAALRTASVRIGPPGRVAFASEQSGILLWRVLADRAVPGARLSQEFQYYYNPFINDSVMVFEVEEHTDVWSIDDPAVPRRIAALPRRVQVFSASSDGRVLLGYEPQSSTEDSGMVRSLWDVSDPAAPTEIALPCDVVVGRVRPDGQVFASTCAEDGGASIRFWRITGNHALQPLAEVPLGSSGTGVFDYSTGGDYLVITEQPDEWARILDVSDEHDPRPWSEVRPGGEGYQFSFSEEDRTLVVHDNVEVSFWSLADPARPERLSTVRTVFPLSHVPVYRPEFGDYVYSDGQEIWRLDRDAHSVTAKICQREDLRLGDDDWRQFLPEVDRVPVCP
ncbi:hypothetical protein ALI22I_44390 [Saccharothrix sp. ALI-22-I]|nr:hypothetical protein ALI22I_44390 [Saccharothrix sp. ALI-22-I]